MEVIHYPGIQMGHIPVRKQQVRHRIHLKDFLHRKEVLLILYH